MQSPLSAESLGFVVSHGVSLPRAVGGHAAGLVKGVPVVTGGTDWVQGPRKVWLNTTSVFHKGRWREGPDLPGSLAHAAFAHDSGGFYVAGGCDGEGQLREVYHLKGLQPTDHWTELKPLPACVQSASGAVLDGRFYVACGEIGPDMSNRMWSLDVSTSGAAWKECRPVPGPPRTLGTLIATSTHLYLLGGVCGWAPLTPLADCLRYEPSTDRWERMKNLPVAGYAWSASRVDSGRALLSGCADGVIRPDIWLLDLDKVTLAKVGDAIIQTTTAPILKVWENEWWLLGGEPDSNRSRTSVVTRIRIADQQQPDTDSVIAR